MAGRLISRHPSWRTAKNTRNPGSCTRAIPLAPAQFSRLRNCGSILIWAAILRPASNSKGVFDEDFEDGNPGVGRTDDHRAEPGVRRRSQARAVRNRRHPAGVPEERLDLVLHDFQCEPVDGRLGEPRRRPGKDDHVGVIRRRWRGLDRHQQERAGELDGVPRRPRGWRACQLLLSDDHDVGEEEVRSDGRGRPSEPADRSAEVLLPL